MKYMTVGKSLHCDPDLSGSTAESSFGGWGGGVGAHFICNFFGCCCRCWPVISTCIKSLDKNTKFSVVTV